MGVRNIYLNRLVIIYRVGLKALYLLHRIKIRFGPIQHFLWAPESPALQLTPSEPEAYNLQRLKISSLTPPLAHAHLRLAHGKLCY